MLKQSASPCESSKRQPGTPGCEFGGYLQFRIIYKSFCPLHPAEAGYASSDGTCPSPAPGWRWVWLGLTFLSGARALGSGDRGPGSTVGPAPLPLTFTFSLPPAAPTRHSPQRRPSAPCPLRARRLPPVTPMLTGALPRGGDGLVAAAPPPPPRSWVGAVRTGTVGMLGPLAPVLSPSLVTSPPTPAGRALHSGFLARVSAAFGGCPLEKAAPPRPAAARSRRAATGKPGVGWPGPCHCPFRVPRTRPRSG